LREDTEHALQFYFTMIPKLMTRLAHYQGYNEFIAHALNERPVSRSMEACEITYHLIYDPHFTISDFGKNRGPEQSAQTPASWCLGRESNAPSTKIDNLWIPQVFPLISAGSLLS